MGQKLRQALLRMGEIEIDILRQLDGLRSGEKVIIRLPKFDKYLSQIVPRCVVGHKYKKGWEESLGNRRDVRFLNSLKSEKMIDCLYRFFDEKAIVTMKSKKKYKQIREWLEFVRPNLVEYGMISLDQARGDVYFLDQKKRLTPDKGMYLILEKLVTDNTHTITAENIMKLKDKKQDHRGESVVGTKQGIARQVIYDLKRSLGWNENGMSDLIELQSDKKYHLLPFLPGK